MSDGCRVQKWHANLSRYPILGLIFLNFSCIACSDHFLIASAQFSPCQLLAAICLLSPISCLLPPSPVPYAKFQIRNHTSHIPYLTSQIAASPSPTIPAPARHVSPPGNRLRRSRPACHCEARAGRWRTGKPKRAGPPAVPSA